MNLLALRQTISCFLLSVIIVHASNSTVGLGSKGFSIERILREANFGARFPIEEQLVNKYGKGFVQKPYKEETWHTYFVPDQRLWIRCKIEANKTNLQPLTEILASVVPLSSKKVPPTVSIGHIQLKGVHLQENADVVLQKWGTPSRSESAVLNGIETMSYHYLRASLDFGTSISFYVRGKTIVAFSVSSSE